MHLVQKHADRDCCLHGKLCVMGIEDYVPSWFAVACAELVAQFCEALPNRREVSH